MPTVLRRMRLSRGLSTRALGADVGVSHVTILRLERGQSAGHPSTRVALERALNAPIDVLLMPDPNGTEGN